MLVLAAEVVTSGNFKVVPHGANCNNLLTLEVSFTEPLKINLHGNSNPPCGRSYEYHLAPLTSHIIFPSRCKKSKQSVDIERGTWPAIISSSLTTATAYGSLGLLISRLHCNSSPKLLVHTSL